jgi:UDP-N-acetylglucosamine acyltransferase
VTVHRGTNADDKTVIGSHNNFLSYAHIAHDCKVGNHCIFSNNGTLAGHVVVGDHVILGGLSAVHQFCRIGTGAMTGGCTKIVQDLAPHMIADGNPAAVRSVNTVGMQRAGYSEAAVRVVKEAHRLLYRKDLNVQQALGELRVMQDVDGLLAELIAFVDSSERGIIR